MSKKMLFSIVVLALTLTVLAASSAQADSRVLSATFSKEATSCGIWWFDKDWNEVWIAGEGQRIQQPKGSFVVTCKFTLDLADPNLLSREAFCAEDWAKFMCKGNGSLVDNRTSCNLEGVVVHNGNVVAGPSGEGMFICHVK